MHLITPEAFWALLAIFPLTLLMSLVALWALYHMSLTMWREFPPRSHKLSEWFAMIILFWMDFVLAGASLGFNVTVLRALWVRLVAWYA